MSVNLIDNLRNSFTEKSYQDISQHVGISAESTKNGLNAMVPAVLACILGNNTATSSTQPEWWNAMKDEYPYSDKEYIETDKISNRSFHIKGKEVLSSMFQTNHDELVKSISSVAGIQKEKSAGLIGVGVPLIIGYLNNWLRKKGWKFNDLISNLIENKSAILSGLPEGISPANFGVRSLKDINNKLKDDFSKTIETDIPSQQEAIKKNQNGMMWIAGLLILILLLWYFLGNKSCDRSVKVDSMTPAVKDTISERSFYKANIDGPYYAIQMNHDFTYRTVKQSL